MSIRHFTDEEIKALKENCNVLKVTPKSISLKLEFKQKIYNELINGKEIETIMSENGFDITVLGAIRLNGIKAWVLKKQDSEYGFADLRKVRINLPNNVDNLTTEQRIKRLETELEYTKQELEFVKKIHFSELEARKLWESKHQQK